VQEVKISLNRWQESISKPDITDTSGEPVPTLKDVSGPWSSDGRTNPDGTVTLKKHDKAHTK
jgi:hypothetical protein